MKYFYCDNCHAYLGEMEKGRFKLGAICLCQDCGGLFKMLLNDRPKAAPADMPDFMKDFFGGFNK